MVIRVNTDYQHKDPRIMAMLFGDTRMAVLWLVVRVYVGWQWLESGRQKMTDPGWMDGGRALRASWEGAVGRSGGGVAPIDGWYREAVRFMLDHQWYGWCGKVIAVSEVVVGLALILGLLTGVAAFIGALLSFNVLLAGATGASPLVFVAALGLIAAWKVAGYVGLDAFVLPKLGAPWRSGLSWKRIRPGARPRAA